MRKILPSLVAVSVVVLAAGVAAAGDPKTSLGVWMQNGDNNGHTMPNAMSGGSAGQDSPDFALLQTLFAKLLTKEPPAATYPKWDSFLQQGMTAAKASDKAGVKASCKGCHDAYKKSYIADANTPKPPASYF